MTTLNHNIFNRRNLVIALIVVGFLILALITFRGCDRSPSHKEDVREVKALQDKLKITEDDKAADSTRLVRRGDSLQTSLLDLQNKQDVIKRELAVTKSRVQTLASANERAKTSRDTARYIETCDSLKDLAMLQGEILDMYQFNDSARTANYEEQLSAKDSLLANRAALIVQLRNTNNETYGALMQVNTDYNKVSRKLKRERTLSRVLAAGLAIAGGALLLK
jgi:hypothetical protein